MTTYDRATLIEISSLLIERINKRLSGERFRSTESDGIQLQYVRILVNLIETHNQLLKDADAPSLKGIEHERTEWDELLEQENIELVKSLKRDLIR